MLSQRMDGSYVDLLTTTLYPLSKHPTSSDRNRGKKTTTPVSIAATLPVLFAILIDQTFIKLFP